jgi:hypothetical protein
VTACNDLLGGIVPGAPTTSAPQPVSAPTRDLTLGGILEVTR